MSIGEVDVVAGRCLWRGEELDLDEVNDLVGLLLRLSLNEALVSREGVDVDAVVSAPVGQGLLGLTPSGQQATGFFGTADLSARAVARHRDLRLGDLRYRTTVSGGRGGRPSL